MAKLRSGWNSRDPISQRHASARCSAAEGDDCLHLESAKVQYKRTASVMRELGLRVTAAPFHAAFQCHAVRASRTHMPLFKAPADWRLVHAQQM